MRKDIGFFDVDCLELNETETGLSFRPRVDPIATSLIEIYEYADTLNACFVFTTCCSGRMPHKGALRHVLHVPLEKDDTSWQSKLEDYRHIYLAKKTLNQPRKNFDSCTFDMFAYNENAVSLFSMLGIKTWVVFGNGFDLCVDTTIRGLVKAGFNIILLEDVLIRSAGGYGPYGSPAYFARLMKEYAELGIRITTLARFMASSRFDSQTYPADAWLPAVEELTPRQSI